jgi:hypothetical protein
MYLEIYRLLADEREREVKDLIRVRSLVGGRRQRSIAQPPRRTPQARTR